MSLFYFGDALESNSDHYRLLMEGALFADQRGFAAIWTPERHFHPFGGGFPNPAVTGAAVAAITKRVGIRAGSVVAPLHPPVRIAEEWSVVDNLSHGRVGVSFASGWHSVDFAIRPENYACRKDALFRTVDTVRALWRREEIRVVDGAGHEAMVRIYPTPVQPDLPVWLTSAGNVETFRAAGRMGVGVLTHLAGRALDDLAVNIAAYRRSLAIAHPQTIGHVALMLHTFLGDDRASVKERVGEPFRAYLRSSIGLILRASGDLMPDVQVDNLSADDVEFLIDHSFEHHFDTGGLFGTVEDALAMLEKVRACGVDEVACLIDFVSDTDAVLHSLEYLDRLHQACGTNFDPSVRYSDASRQM